MATLDVNGTSIAYQQMGEGPDVVLVHGLATSRAFWLATAFSLKANFRVTLYDLRGHGYSATPESGYDARTQAGDLAALFDHLEIGQATVIGHSFGGSVALEFAVANPRRVTRLALLDAKINRLQPQLRLDDNDVLTPFEAELVAEADEDWSQETQIGLKFLEVVARRRVEGVQTTTTNDFVPFADQRGSGRAARKWLSLLEDTTAWDDFLSVDGATPDAIARLTMPVLLVYGELSRCMRSGEALEDLLEQAMTIRVPDAGHFFPATRLPLVLGLLGPFLRGRTPALPTRPTAPARRTAIPVT